MSMKEFRELPLSDFIRKFKSIPENEPLFTIIKARTINTSKIKDKQEKKYWNELKRINKIPSEYLSVDEILNDLSKFAKEKKI